MKDVAEGDHKGGIWKERGRNKGDLTLCLSPKAHSEGVERALDRESEACILVLLHP